MKILIFFIFVFYNSKKLSEIEYNLGFDLDTGTLIDDLEKL